MLWKIRMRGGFFVYESWLDDLKSAGASYSRYCNEFFEKRTKYWMLEYHPELFKGDIGLADPGNEYILYLDEQHTADVDLTNATGAFYIQWFNPRTGDVKDEGISAGGGHRVFKTPDSEDWVLHIFKDIPNQHIGK